MGIENTKLHQNAELERRFGSAEDRFKKHLDSYKTPKYFAYLDRMRAKDLEDKKNKK